MVVIGADVHKRTHTFVAVDDVGRELGSKTVPATTPGHTAAVQWGRENFSGEVIWGIEDCRNLSARLERDLLSAGQKVVRVAPKLMALQRAGGRARGKSDPIDALAVARAVLREPDLPVAAHDAVSRELKLLVDRREDLVVQRTSIVNRFLGRVHELDPAHSPKKRSLDRAKTQKALADWLATLDGLLAELAADELADIVRLTATINALTQRIGTAVQAVSPTLLALPGCGELTAAKLVGESAGITRFTSEAAFARHNGTAPIPAWSGNTAGRMRLNRTGNRQLNAALHRIAITQVGMTSSAGQAYYRKRLAGGDSSAEALRCLKRRLSRTVFNRLHADQKSRHPTNHQAAA
ncbi:IS110 family transposase [Mycolicibacterium pallens]|uniref:IS110 family transposase n=1 Tax=Mycolicibacterium pallens TaxID=370524 RepID=A0ABX8VA23_9MYCO|nr:IS110 family transposase [Mycolicibacterium pallens]APE15624.1 IS110 family transposase [Mycobacterium sp. WY10]QYL14639.1 IS110 family transposase [Mycolicibacterium pallens]